MNDSEIKNLMEKYGFRGWSPDVFYDMKNLLEEYKEKIQQEEIKFLGDLEIEATRYNIKKHKHFVSKIQERIAKLKGAKGK